MRVEGGILYLILNTFFLLLCFIYCVLELKIKKNERKYILFVIMLLFSALMACRPAETKDTLEYIDFFENVDIGKDYSFHFLYKYQGVEYGFLYLTLFMKKLHFNYKVFFGAVAFFNILISVNYLQRMKNYILSSKSNGREELYGAVLTGYIVYVGVLYNGIGIRGGLSISLSLMAIDCYIRKKYKIALACGVIAITFQRVCIVLLFAILANRLFKIRSKKQCLGIWLVQGALLVTNLGNYCIEKIAESVRVLFSRMEIGGFSGYLYSFDSAVGKIDWLIWIVIGVCIYCWNDEKICRFFLRIVLMGGWVIVFLHGVRAISRMYDYYIMFSIPLFAARYYQVPNIRLSRVKLFLLAVMSTLGIMTLKLSFF